MGWSFFKRRESAHKEAKSALPSWEEVIADCYDRSPKFSKHVAVLYTPEGDFRAAITRRNSGGYQVIYEQLIPFDEEELKYLSDGSLGFWSPCGWQVSIFDSAEKARKEIRAALLFKV